MTMLCLLGYRMFKPYEKMGQESWLGFRVGCVQRTADLVAADSPRRSIADC